MNVKVYVALGANLGNPPETLKKAAAELRALGKGFTVSSFHWTAPVSPIPQPDFLNAVASFTTSLTIEALFSEMEAIEVRLGKKKKEKEAPRLIDLDLLFYGEEEWVRGELVVPHPRWKERLFVIDPLLELTESIVVNGVKWDLKELRKQHEKS